MRRQFVQSMCLAVLIAGSIGAASAQNQQLEKQKQNPSNGTFITARRPVVNTSYVMHVIKAAENAYHQGHRRFGSWQELYDSRALWVAQSAVDEWRRVVFANGSEAIPGYRVSLIVSADGASYSISLRDISSNGCGLSMYSDENGPIYQGVSLDCPKTVER